MIRIYDRDAMIAAVPGGGADDEWTSDVGAPAPVLTVEDEARARCLRGILDDPRGNLRPPLHGTDEMAARLRNVTAAMPHFDAVTGIVERAIIQSARTGYPIRIPPILMLSPPGHGKSHLSRILSEALGTTCVSIAINLVAERGGLGGLSPVWRGARMGKLAHGLVVASATAAPLYLLDEIDKPSLLAAGETTTDVLLSALEPENASHFRDEYLDVDIDLSSALWLASANETASMPGPLVDRFLVLEIPRPDAAQARVLVEAIATIAVRETNLIGIADEAAAALIGLSPRRIRRVVEIACGFAVCARHGILTFEDVRQALELVERGRRTPMGFLR